MLMWICMTTSCGPRIHAAWHAKIQVFTVYFNHVISHWWKNHPQSVGFEDTVCHGIVIYLVKTDCECLHLQVHCCVCTWTTEGVCNYHSRSKQQHPGRNLSRLSCWNALHSELHIRRQQAAYDQSVYHAQTLANSALISVLNKR